MEDFWPSGRRPDGRDGIEAQVTKLLLATDEAVQFFRRYAMNETDLIQLQVNRTITLLSTNITRYYDALHELRRLSLILFEKKQPDPADINVWFERDGFGIDADGFWQSLPLLDLFRSGKVPEDAISYSWHPKLKDHKEARFRMYCLRNIGTFLHEIHSRLPEIAWIYYQDITNTAIQFPYIDQKTAIPPDFDWSTYHTYLSVEPRSNPERVIRWTPPTIDYAGEGLILSVSIPVYLKENFVGLWSIDIPMRSLYRNYIQETYVDGQENFIINQEGRIVVHPFIEARIDGEKGSFFQEEIRTLGGDFEKLDPASLIKNKSGKLQLRGEDGQELLVYYGAVPDINWLFFATVPRFCMLDAVNRRIKAAFDRLKKGDLTYRIKKCPYAEQRDLIIDGYNEMVSVLQQQEESRLQIEEALKESERRQADIINFLPDATLVIDREGKVIAWNGAMEKMTGIPAGEMLGKGNYEYTIPFYGKRRPILIDHVFQSHEELVAGYTFIKREHGTLCAEAFTPCVGKKGRHLYGKTSTLYDAEGNIIGAIESIRDVTEYRRAQEALQESEERYRSFVQNFQGIAFRSQSDFTLVFLHGAVKEITGYTEEEFVARRPAWGRIIHPDDLPAVYNSWKKVISVPLHSTEQEYRIIRKDSQVRWLRELIQNVCDDSGRPAYIQGTIHDITERRQVEDEIRHLSRRLINGIEEEKKKLAVDLHDEFGQTLTALHMGTEALQDSLPAELKDQKKRCRALIALIEQLGDNIRKICSELRPDMIDHLELIPTFKWYINDFANRWQDIQFDFQAIGFKKRLAPEVEIVLYRILQEGMHNIVKHANAKHVRLNLTYSHPKVIFTIKDDGVGFEQSERARQLESEKRGIGLLGMQERVASVGGNIKIRSRKGQGTVIRIEIPNSLEMTNA